MRGVILLAGLMLTSIDTAIDTISFRGVSSVVGTGVEVISFRSLMLSCAMVTLTLGLIDMVRYYRGTGRYRVMEHYGPYKEDWKLATGAGATSTGVNVFSPMETIKFQLMARQAFDNYLKCLAICPFCKNRETQLVGDELTLQKFNSHYMGPFHVYSCPICTARAQKIEGAHSVGGTSRYVPPVTWHFSLIPENHCKILMPVLDRDEEVEEFIMDWHTDYINRCEPEIDQVIDRQVEFHQRAA